MSQEVNTTIEKIEAVQLEKLQAFENFMKEAKLVLGDLLLGYEAQKQAVLNQVMEQQKMMAVLEKEIKEVHGDDVRINIETGEILKQPVEKMKMEEAEVTA